MLAVDACFPTAPLHLSNIRENSSLQKGNAHVVDNNATYFDRSARVDDKPGNYYPGQGEEFLLEVVCEYGS